MNGSLIMWAVVVLILALVIAAFGYIFYRVFGTGEPLPPVAVSYTHLTLPTILLV